MGIQEIMEKIGKEYDLSPEIVEEMVIDEQSGDMSKIETAIFLLPNKPEYAQMRETYRPNPFRNIFPTLDIPSVTF